MGNEQVIVNSAVRIDHEIHYTSTDLKLRYNWIHSVWGNETKTDSIYKYHEPLELAII